MSDSDAPKTTQDCPDCGHPNAVDAASCERCNFPLHTPAPVEAEAPASTEEPEAEAPTSEATESEAPEPKSETPMSIPVPPRLQKLRKKKRTNSISTSIWLFTGALAAMSLVLFAIKSNVDRIAPEVQGADPETQARANELHAAVEEDSTNVAAQVALADVLYDTGNWPDAIIHYRSAVRQDSSQHEAIVDLGVCYYNLGDTATAEEHFMLALAKVPHQTVALFNMGILNERREDYETALEYYHRALQTDPRDAIKQPIIEALTRAQMATGKTAPPLPDGQ